MVPQDHPLRPIRKMVDQALEELSPEFNKMYSRIGRPSVPPEKLLKGLLLQTLFSIRSVRQLMQEVGYNILYKWFLGLAIDDKVWDHSNVMPIFLSENSFFVIIHTSRILLMEGYCKLKMLLFKYSRFFIEINNSLAF